MRKLALAVALVVLAGCSGIQKLAASAVQKPKVTFRSASLDHLDLEAATLGFTFDVENPNGFGVHLAHLAWALDAEGKRVAAGELPGGLEIRANATSPVTFPVRVRFQDVPGIVSLLGSGKETVRYALAGSLGVRTPIGVIDLALSHDGTVRLPGTPAFALDGIAIRSLGFTEIVFDVRLKVKNPNPFPLPLGKLDCGLAIAGAHVAKAGGVDVHPVAAGATAVVAIPVRLEIASAGRAASALAGGGEVEVDLAGAASLAGLAFPLDLKAKVPARR